MAGKTQEPIVISNVGALQSGPTPWVKLSDDCNRMTFWLKPEGKLSVVQNRLVSGFWIPGLEQLWSNECFFKAPSFGSSYLAKITYKNS